MRVDSFDDRRKRGRLVMCQDRWRVLIVEDEMMIAMMIEGMIADMGHEVAAVASSLQAGLAAVANRELDIAVLDMNLDGKPSFPIADCLVERRVPFVFASGYGMNGLKEAYRGVPTISKPFECSDLERAMKMAHGGSLPALDCGSPPMLDA